MENNPNQTSQPDDSQNTDIDARIAAEHYNTGQYGAYEYEESLFDRITSAIAANKLLLIPVIAVPVIVIGAALGISTANSNKKANHDKLGLAQTENPIEYSIETIGSDSSDDAGTLPTAGDPETNTSTTNRTSSSSRTTPTNTTTRIDSRSNNTGTTPSPTPTSPTVDLCVNLGGNQATVPAGYTRDGAGKCNLPPVITDLCSNLSGTQATIPSGYIRNTDGSCTVRVADLCVNISGTQASVPSGYVRDSAGKCTLKPVVVASKIDIRPWKVTLPVGSGGDPIEQVASKLYSPWYTKISSGYQMYVDSARATARTPNSPNIRTELREMQVSNPSKVAKWYPSSGVHQLLVRLKVTKNTGKGNVVIAQIHGADDDVTVFRLERISSTHAKLWFTRGDTSHGFDPHITVALNQVITVGFKVQANKIHYYYSATGSKNPKIVHTWAPSGGVASDFKGGSYFKTGNYQQSSGYGGRSETNVVVIGLGLSHSSTLPNIGGN